MPRRRLLPALSTLLLLAAAARGDDWPQFRGPNRDGISLETGLLRAWPEEGPEVLWTVPACEGYASPAIVGDWVYFNDYVREENQWVVRCLSLETGEERWRFAEARRIRPNHGITRTVPAVDGQYVFAFDPKCVLHCLDAATGEERWRRNFVKEYKARIPAWYNGQCPLLEEDRILIATGGDALMVALNKETGEEIWRTPNPEKWLMSHSSLMPATFGGVQQYLYCTLQGVMGISAEDGALLWHHPYKFNVAVAPSPLAVDDELVFMTSCYEAGSVMIRVRREEEAFVTEEVFAFRGNEWNSEVHTPIVHEDHLFAVGKKRRGLLTCLDRTGGIVWESSGQASFGLGGFIFADGMFFILEGKTGTLRLVEASTAGYRELASAELLTGGDVWAPPALSRGRLIVRDMSKMICLKVGASDPGGE